MEFGLALGSGEGEDGGWKVVGEEGAGEGCYEGCGGA